MCKSSPIKLTSVDHLRKLEGAGLTILSLEMGAAERKQWRWAGPICSVLIAAAMLYFVCFA